MGNQSKHMRQANIELLRFVCMALVVLCHLTKHQIGDYPVNGLLRHGLQALTLMTSFHVDVFILITGYFGVRRNLKSLVNSLTMMLWYGVILGLVKYWIIGEFDWKSVLMPITHSPWWFMRNYVFLILLAPFIELIIVSLKSNRDWIALVSTMLFLNVWCSWLMEDKVLYHKDFSLFNFFTMYVLGSYVRYSLKSPTEDRNIVLNRLGGKSLLLILLLLMGLKLIIWVACAHYSVRCSIAGYDSFLTVPSAVVFFLLFQRTAIQPHKWVYFLSASCLSIYMITDYKFVRLWLRGIYREGYETVASNMPLAITYTLVFFLCLLIVPVVIDQLRLRILPSLNEVLISKIEQVAL